MEILASHTLMREDKKNALLSEPLRHVLLVRSNLIVSHATHISIAQRGEY